LGGWGFDAHAPTMRGGACLTQDEETGIPMGIPVFLTVTNCVEGLL
jgi:hypothetical protein